MAKHGDIRIGVSGWTYRPWRGNFYPAKLVQRQELSYAAHQFNALEINGTFYGMQVPKAFRKWTGAVPEGFVFAVKGPRYLTHMLRLKDPEPPLANFFASGPLVMGEKLGPVKSAVEAGLGLSIISKWTIKHEVALGLVKPVRIKGVSFVRQFYAVRLQSSLLPIPAAALLHDLRELSHE